MSTISSEHPNSDVGQCELHCNVFGHPGSLPDIVLDHGGGGSADDWNNVLPLLAAHSRVLSYDRAGMGDSPADGLGCGTQAVSGRLASLVELTGVRKPFILVGYSLGGLYARYYAQRYPQDVVALVLVDATPTAMDIPKSQIRKAMRVVAVLHWLARAGFGKLYWYLSGRKIDANKFKRMLARFAAPSYLQCMREETDAIAGVQADVARVASQLKHPTLALIAGVAPKNVAAEDVVRVRGLHTQLAQSAPAPLSRMTVIEGATHATLVSDPQYAAQLAEHILAFARSLPSACSLSSVEKANER